MVEKAYKPPIDFKPSLDTPKVQQREFSETWAEWASKNREVIREEVNTIPVDYTVPDNKTLFITSLSLSGSTNLTTGTVSIGSAGVRLLQLQTAAATNGVISQTFPSPLRIESGEVLTITSSAPATATALVFGWLEQQPS